MRIKMALVAVLLILCSYQVMARDNSNNSNFNLETYGVPPLYYSKESIMQRNELEQLQLSNEIAKQRLNVETEQLRQQQEIHDQIRGNELINQ